MLRLLRLPARCVLVCDEFARLGVQGRAALDLLAVGREFGKRVILSSREPSDFGELRHHALDQAAQAAACVLAFPQGARDASPKRCAATRTLVRVLGRLERERAGGREMSAVASAGVNTHGYAKTTVKGQKVTVY
jgi:hypothetical protein